MLEEAAQVPMLQDLTGDNLGVARHLVFAVRVRGLRVHIVPPECFRYKKNKKQNLLNNLLNRH